MHLSFFISCSGYLHENDHTPFLEIGKVTYTPQDIVAILLSALDLEKENKVCSCVPTDVSCSSSYLINLSSLDDAKDITCDGMGAYSTHGSPKEFAYVQEDHHGNILSCVTKRTSCFSATEIVRKGLENSTCFKLERLYSRLKSSPDLLRIIYRLKKLDNKVAESQHSYCMVQYRFDGEDHNIKAVCHGNARSNFRPYKPTKSSVRRALEVATVSDPSPTSVMAKVNKAAGGYMSATGSGMSLLISIYTYNDNETSLFSLPSSFSPMVSPNRQKGAMTSQAYVTKLQVTQTKYFPDFKSLF